MDERLKIETDALANLLERDGIKILPGSQVPDNADYHVCTTQPKPGGFNHQGRCVTCKTTVYFQDVVNIPKICVPCYLKLGEKGKTENYGNVNSLTQAVLREKAN